MKPAYLQYDSLDDRREICTLLRSLPPWRRVAFLADCCRRATLPNSRTSPFVTPKTRGLADRARTCDRADERLTVEIYFDVWTLATQYDFDLDAALRRLESQARSRC